MKRSYRHWSRDEVVREVRRLHREGSQLNSGHVSRTYPALSYAARKYLGGWESAIRAAGYDYGRIRRKYFWNRKTVVERICELRAAGEPLNVSSAEKRHGGLVGAATLYFGSWGAAIKASGLDYRKVKRQKEWSKREIRHEIRRLAKLGMALSTTMQVRKSYRTLHAAAVRYFGSWAQAVAAAGLGKLARQTRGCGRKGSGVQGFEGPSGSRIDPPRVGRPESGASS